MCEPETATQFHKCVFFRLDEFATEDTLAEILPYRPDCVSAPAGAIQAEMNKRLSSYVLAKRRKRSGLGELPLVLLVFFLLAVFPLLDLMNLAVAGTTMCLFAHQAASAACVQRSYPEALSAAEQQSKNLLSTGMASMLKMKPAGGANNSGMNLLVKATSYYSGKIQTFGPNTPVPPPIDTYTNIYEFVSVMNYDVGPFFPVAFLSNVPGVGCPARLSFSAHRMVEYPAGLVGQSNPALSGGNGGVDLDPANLDVDTPGQPVSGSRATWLDPNIYTKIEQSGQTIVDEDVLKIYANDRAWQDTGLNIQPGCKVWIDYQSVGQWSWYDGHNCAGSGIGSDLDRNHNWPKGSMVGVVGNNGNEFLMSDHLWNYPPPGTGRLFMGMNTNIGPIFSSTPRLNDLEYAHNQGFLTVRVIITK